MELPSPDVDVRALLVTAAIVVAIGVVITIVGLIVANVVGRRINNTMRRLLGDWYDYAAMFYVVIACVVAALAVLLFVVPWWVWLGLVLLVLISAVALAEMA